MNNDAEKIELRIQNMKKFYLNADKLLESLPDAIPSNVKKLLKDKILGDAELKNLMEGIDAHRPPRIFLIGRTGVGKSSLINAICGAYIADVSDTKSCTENAQVHKYMDGNRVLMEIFDTRGIAESVSLDSKETSEDMLIDQINEFSPDVAILVLGCTHRDDVDSDVLFLKKLAESYHSVNDARLPIVAVVNKCDEMKPARQKKAEEYSPSKIANIQEVVKYYKEIIRKNDLQIKEIVPVSSLIDWQTPDGIEVDSSNIDSIPESDIENLQIAFDGRYNIEELLDILEKAILDCEAQMGLRMAARLNKVVLGLAEHLNKVFSGIAATVATTPIPVSDIYILLILQSILVYLIAALSGRDVTLDSAKEFVLGLGGIGAAGYAFRLLAQQSAKLLNTVFFGAGSTVSSAIAAAGTWAIGQAAIAYYINKKDIDEVKRVFESSKA